MATPQHNGAQAPSHASNPEISVAMLAHNTRGFRLRAAHGEFHLDVLDPRRWPESSNLSSGYVLVIVIDGTAKVGDEVVATSEAGEILILDYCEDGLHDRLTGRSYTLEEVDLLAYVHHSITYYMH